MGLFDKLFKNEKSAPMPHCEPLTVYAPAEGEVIPLERFPDAVFSQEILGPGCGILPTGKRIVAPFNGTVIQAVESRHAVGVASEDGMEILIHVGVDTVEMNGKGFQYHVKNGQQIRLGEPLIEFDREIIRQAGHPDAIAVVVTNADEYSAVELRMSETVSEGTAILTVKK